MERGKYTTVNMSITKNSEYIRTSQNGIVEYLVFVQNCSQPVLIWRHFETIKWFFRIAQDVEAPTIFFVNSSDQEKHLFHKMLSCFFYKKIYIKFKTKPIQNDCRKRITLFNFIAYHCSVICSEVIRSILTNPQTKNKKIW